MSRKKSAAQEFENRKADAMIEILGITEIQFAVGAGIALASLVLISFVNSIIQAYK